MAQTLSGVIQIHPGGTTTVDSSALVQPGTRARDNEGGEWIYLQGTTSVVGGNWVRYAQRAATAVQPFDTALADADDVGPLAVAGSAIGVGQYGWFQIYGRCANAGNSGAVAANVALYLTVNSGYVDDADVAGDFIEGATSAAASSGSTFVAWLNYPAAYNVAQD